MSGSEEQDRSEKPTPFKLAQAREKGTVARGADLGYLTSLGAFVGLCWICGPGYASDLSMHMRDTLVGSTQLVDGNQGMLTLAGRLSFGIAGPLMNLAGILFVTVLIFEIIQTGVLFSFQPLKADFTRLNPVQGIKRLFSIRLLIETVKNVLKLAVYACAAWIIIYQSVEAGALRMVDARTLVNEIGQTAFRLLTTFVLIAVCFAIIDQVIVRRAFIKRMRMSRQEVKREHRDREGEPRLKQKRKAMHAEFVKNSQSLRGVRNADVLIANPEHIALALRYDKATMEAPLIVAIGRDHFAQRLKRLAFLHGVVIVEDRALAQKMFPAAALNQPIPEIFYRSVAEIYKQSRVNRRNAHRTGNEHV